MGCGVGIAIHPQFAQSRSGEAPFVPSDIAGLKLWLDPSDTATLFQDASGTTPATANNDPVRRINDKSGGGNNAIASADSKRPLLKIGAGLKWLSFDGSDDCLSIASFALNASAGEATYFLAGQITTPASVGILIESSANYGASANGYVLYANSDGTSDAGVSGPGGVNAYSYSGLQSAVIVIAVKMNKATPTGAQTTVYKNSVMVTGAEVAGNNSGGNFGAEAIYIGMRADSSLPTTMTLYGLIAYDSLLSDADREAVETYLAGKCGVTL